MDELKKAAVNLGKLGGLATKKKHGKEYYRNIGKLGGEAGKGSKKRKDK